MSRASFIACVDAALARVEERGMEVRAIYLTVEDHERFNNEMSRRLKRRAAFLSYQDHAIRRGKRTMIYSTHGIGVSIATSRPRVLPPKDIPIEMVIERLDQLSRTRALTLEESLILERAIKGKPVSKRAAARVGVKRNMGAYA